MRSQTPQQESLAEDGLQEKRAMNDDEIVAVRKKYIQPNCGKHDET